MAALVIGVLGGRLGGKDTVANYLVERYAAEHMRHSHVLDEILEILDVPKSRRNEIDLAMALRDLFGEGILGSALKKRVLNSRAPVIALNGMRFPGDIDNARNLGAKIVYITAPEDMRFERFLKRQEKADDGRMTFEEFQALENEPTEIGIPALGKQADYQIDNTGSINELYAKIDHIMKELHYGTV